MPANDQEAGSLQQGDSATAQVGRHANVVEAGRAATAAGGGGLFRGTAALLSREVPFYMFGERGSGLRAQGSQCSAPGVQELLSFGSERQPACILGPLPDLGTPACAGMVGYQQLKKVANGACFTLTASLIAAVQKAFPPLCRTWQNTHAA